jgi:hypothetical protein
MIIHAEFVDFDSFIDACQLGDLAKLKYLFRTFSTSTKKNQYLRKRALKAAQHNKRTEIVNWLIASFSYTEQELKDTLGARPAACEGITGYC